MKWILSRVGTALLSLKWALSQQEGQTLKAGCLHLRLHPSGGSRPKVQKSWNTEIDPIQQERQVTSESKH